MSAVSAAPDDFPPAWASSWGQDGYGFFAEIMAGEVSILLRWIPPGQFLMGFPDGNTNRDPDEKPQHTVILSHGFWMAATPCTQEQYRAVTGQSPSRFKGDRLPVETVSWLEVREYCCALNRLIQEAGVSSPGLEFRLPTEAEWEYACRAGTDSDFNDGSPCTVPSGQDPALDGLGWFDKNSDGKTHPVGEKVPNTWGLYDMHGNVWEWCWDGKRTFTAEALTDPLGPTDEQAGRALRGGSCWSNARSCRSACRDGGGPGGRRDDFGFRLAAGQPVAERSPGG